MSPVDEGLIHAWLDEQLPPDEAARVAGLVATDPAWAAAAAEARGLIAASARILGALDDTPAVRAVGTPPAAPVAPAPSVRAPRPWYAAPWLAAAAGVVLVVGVGSEVWRQSPPEATVAEVAVPPVTVEAPSASTPAPPTTVVPPPVEPRVAAPTTATTAERREVAAADVATPPAVAITPPLVEKGTVSAAAAANAGAAAGVVERTLQAAGGRGGVSRTLRDTSVAQRTVVVTAPPVPLVERGTVGSGIRSFAPIPSACWYPLTSAGAVDSAGVVELSALSVAQDSAVVTRWMTVDGVTVSFAGRLTGDTLIGRVRESAGDIRQLPRDVKLLRGACRRD